MAYNTSLQPTTEYLPFFLMFGRQACLLIEIVYGMSDITPQPASEYAAALQRMLGSAYERVQKNFKLKLSK